MMKKLLLAVFFLTAIAADDVTVGDLSARLDDIEKRMDGRTPSGDDLPSYEDFEIIKQQLKELNGKYEELEHALNQVRQKLNLPGTAAVSTIAQALPQEEIDVDGLSDEEAVLKIMSEKDTSTASHKTTKKEALGILQDKKRVEAEKTVPSLEDGSPLAQYNQAMALHEKNELDKSERAFKEFIKSYPKNKLTHQAYYWLGDCQLKLKKNNQAKASFVQCYQHNKTGPKAPDALYCLGLSLAEEKKKEQACTAWKKLQSDFSKLTPDLKKKLTEAKKKHKC